MNLSIICSFPLKNMSHTFTVKDLGLIFVTAFYFFYSCLLSIFRVESFRQILEDIWSSNGFTDIFFLLEEWIMVRNFSILLSFFLLQIYWHKIIVIINQWYIFFSVFIVLCFHIFAFNWMLWKHLIITQNIKYYVSQL